MLLYLPDSKTKNLSTSNIFNRLEKGLLSAFYSPVFLGNQFVLQRRVITISYHWSLSNRDIARDQSHEMG